MTKQDTIRAAAIELLRSGLATQSEVAELTGVSRQAVAKWAAGAEIDPVEARGLWLRTAWKRAVKRER